MRRTRYHLLYSFLVLWLILGFQAQTYAQQRNKKKGPVPTLGLDQGFLNFETPNFHLKLVKASQTIAGLEPKGADGFDFTPADWLERRNGDGYYHLGDITLRLRKGDSGQWKNYATATHRTEVKPLDVSSPRLAGALLNPTLPDDIPLQIKRYWKVEDGHLVLSFELKNTSDEPVQIGGLGIPMVFNNILTGRKLPEAHEKCSFYDPYIGRDAGYVQVTRLNGHGPALVVVPENKTPLEAYKPLLSDSTRRGITFEGFYEWMVHTKAYAENEWKGAKQWNKPTAATLKPGQSRTYGVKFLLSDSIQDIEQTLAQNDRPVAKGIPGYILPKEQDAQLFLKYDHKIQSLDVEPAGAMQVSRGKRTKDGWKRLGVMGEKWGRARLLITYDDGTVQSVNYKVIKSQPQVAKDLGHFLTTKQWFDKKDDPFHRDPSVITYDYYAKKQVTEDNRVWIAGLSDEGGAGSWLAAVMKQLVQPKEQEIKKLESFVDSTLWGGIQYSQGDHKYGVRKSMFYYAPDSMPKGTYSEDVHYGGWSSWSRKQARSVGRSYNYVHVAAAYWVLYRLARDHEGLVTNHPWQWYLDHAYNTAQAMVKYAPYYAQFGQMEGTVFLKILKDLQREGWDTKAKAYKKTMKKRADVWESKPFPFGSEMPWDSTGQEEVYAWCNYFGFDAKAQITLDAILGYMPTVPHWGYNGSARRYWDFLFAGKMRRLERQLHHYGSGLNAIPVLTAYRSHPDDYYLLRVGYGGLMGAISNVTKDGFGPSAFHSFPSTLKIDGYSGDYGPNFFGHAINTGTYIINHPEFGWLAFGGNLKKDGDWVSVKPLDTARSRVYLAPAGLWLTLDAGKFKEVRYNPATKEVQLSLDAKTQFTSDALLRVRQPARKKEIGSFKPVKNLKQERGAYVIMLGKKATKMTLEASE